MGEPFECVQEALLLPSEIEVKAHLVSLLYFAVGWASSGDYMQGTSLKFRSKEDAIHFCEKQGWDFFVQEPKTPRIPPKSYAANYSYSVSLGTEPSELRPVENELLMLLLILAAQQAENSPHQVKTSCVFAQQAECMLLPVYLTALQRAFDARILPCEQL
jgi:ETC complex I subunit conserved region